MKMLLLAGAASALVTLTGCAQPLESAAMKGRLDCPESRGQLTRLSQADDGQSCRYRTRDGADVELRLVAVDGDPRAMLAKLEAELGDLSPPAAAAVPVSDGATGSAETTEAAKLAARAIAEAEADASGDSDNVQVSLPGGRVNAQSESVSIALPGLK
ncbi:MAG: hypothetical protein Q8M38_01220, partial [Phenylobacterium sp.]|nr:hypothetical protein [Phenylobacterium sp.]